MTDSFERIAGSPCVLLTHPERGWLEVRGGDRERFLHAMLSNDIRGLAAGRACAALLLNRKGRVLSMLHVLREPDRMWLDTADTTTACVREVLEKHVIADDVDFEDRSAEWIGCSIEGPGARAHLRARELPCPEPNWIERDPEGRLWCGGGALSDLGVRCFGPRVMLDALIGSLELSEPTSDLREALYVRLGVPRYGVDVSDKNFPHEAGLERSSVSFSKGCYIGQEIVARIHSRGAVNRLLVQMEFDGPVEASASISGEERERLGMITSAVPVVDAAARSGAQADAVRYAALGYVAIEAAVPGTRVRVDQCSGEVLARTAAFE